MSKKQRLQKFFKEQNMKIQISLGELTIDSLIGQGGNGIVYKATLFNSEIALKFLITDSRGNSEKQKKIRFLAEYLNIVLQEDLGNIVRYIGYDILIIKDEEGEIRIPIIIMKLYDKSLSNLTSFKREDVFRQLFEFLLDTIEKIHNNGIIHRDIKPENILFKNDEFALADFGIASYNPDIFKLRAETKNSERIGNRLFSAPEQEDGGANPHETMDIYAMGQVLQWYATGLTHRGTARQKITTIFPNLEVYDSVIDKCLRQAPSRRYQNISEIRNFIKRSKKTDIFNFLSLFNEICRSNFPRNDSGIVHCNDKNKIGRLMDSFKKNENEFENTLCWINGNANHDFSLTRINNSIWRFNQKEISITEIWVHFDNSIYNDFILVKYDKGKPFIFETKERYYSFIVNDEYHISDSEYDNNYAEINGEIIDLSNQKVDFVERQDHEGYLFIGTNYHCILQLKNDKNTIDVIELLIKNKNSKLELLRKFQLDIRKNKNEEVKNRL